MNRLNVRIIADYCNIGHFLTNLQCEIFSVQLIMPNSDDRNGMVVYKADSVAGNDRIVTFILSKPHFILFYFCGKKYNQPRAIR